MTFTDTSTPDSGDSPQPRCATSYSWDGTLVVGVLFEGCSLGETARQLARLCSEHDWQRFTGLDVHGHSFPVEVNVTRKMIERRAVFLFNLRRSGSV
jgi:hypothetical protein